MKSLLEKYNEALKDSKYIAKTSETLTCKILGVAPIRDPERCVINTDKGRFFAFRNAFTGVTNPMVLKNINADITLQENGEYVNIVGVSVDLEALGKKAFVASHNIVVSL